MRFIVESAERPVRVVRRYPTAVLRPDRWDDYGFKTMFRVTLHLSATEQVDLDAVKILRGGQLRGPTPMPERPFDSLGSDYCSLGQASSYYELLAHAGPRVFRPFLEGLRDVAFLPEVRAQHADESGMATSLLRFGAAQRALEEAPVLLGRRRRQTAARLSFTYEFPDNGASAVFRFGETAALPHRLAVVIGYNGAGKTRLLADLAMLACADRREAEQPRFVAVHGRYRDGRPSFGAVLAISYSAFDSFAVPGRGRSGNDALDRERISRKGASVRNYSYCGLRRLDASGRLQTSLKSIDQLTDEFHLARARAIANERLGSLRSAMLPLTQEPSFKMIVELPDVAASENVWRRAFARLSTGHKIVLNIVVQLCAHLERRSLVLIDEPEQHLHPPLLAALLQGIGVALELHDSFAVVATHSPVVLQEVPARSVKVLRRSFDWTTVEPPRIETFAENVGLLTKHVFNLDSSLTDYQGVLRDLAETRSLEEIDALFAGRMSSQARSLVMSLRRQWDDAHD